MKFVLVNHRTPLRPSTCSECARSLGSGYLRDVPTRRPYCDQHCYRRYQAKRPLMPWFAATGADHGPGTDYPAELRSVISFAAASCWLYAIPITALSISLVDAALCMHEIAVDGSLEAGPRRA
jgi:hypothetical protein